MHWQLLKTGCNNLTSARRQHCMSLRATTQRDKQYADLKAASLKGPVVITTQQAAL
jgi:hypothetical protein